MAGRFRNIHVELLAHVPFTVFSVAAGMIVVGFMTYTAARLGAAAPAAAALSDHAAHAHGVAESPEIGMFHLFHPVHLLFSATATTAMFWRFERRWLKALVVGTIGSVAICGLSDIFMPYAAGWVLGAHMDLHVCVIEHPMLVLPFAVVGLAVGFMLPSDTRKSTIFSHTSHVFVSAMASLLYLVGFGMSRWADQAGWVLIFMVLSVVIPCCFSDIVFPLVTLKRPCSQCGEPHEQATAEHVHPHHH